MGNEEKTALELAEEAALAKAKATNDTRTGKGTRVAVGMTRGRNPQVVSWEAFDESQPDTLPKSLSEFMDIAKVSDEAVIVSYLLDGFNLSARTNASDPVAEFVDASWPEDVQTRFKASIRNFSRDSGLSIEDAVAIIKPSIVKAQSAAK